MTQPSKAGAVFLFLFGLPFFGFGLFAAWAFLTSASVVHQNNNPILGAAFASVFALIGAGLMVGAIAGYKKQQQQAAIEQTSPDSPWLWQADWATGRALSRNRNSVYGWWIGVVLASMIALPVTIGNLPQLLRNSDPKALLLFGFCLLPTILLIGAVRATMRRERYGKTYFEFNSAPFSPGKRVSGQIHLRLNTSADHGIDLRLSCIRRVVTGSGKEQSTNEIVLWQDQKNVPQTALTVGPLGNAIPVDFGIPQDAYETNHDNPRDQLLWVLHAAADVPGIDYSDNFELPVFRSGANLAPASDSAAGFATGFSSGGSAAAGTAPAFDSDATEISAPPNPRVVVSMAPDGSTEFYFPAFRNKSQALILLLFTAIWSGAVYFLAHSRAPFFFAIVFGFFDLLLIYGCFQYLFGSTRIVIGNGKIISLRKIFGAGTPREFPFGDVQSVVASMGLQSSNANQANYSIRLQTRNGKKISLADNITDRQEARWIVSRIEKLAGLKIDTHVVLAGPFGNAYAPPPQRGFSGSAPLAGKPKRNVAAGLIGFAMFLAWSGFVLYKFVGSQHTVTQRRSSPAKAVSQTSIRHTYAALTDEDIERLHQAPIQDQSEELLERAIQHDSRALDIFEQNIDSESWRGNIKLTDRMKNLEGRSQYSSDLRVRYANADLNLSMEGWAKNDQSAELLIQRAQSDTQYRAAAVYYMGMLAGRDVAYSRIHPVLLDYAQHDPDARVRQWAVEGMRYLATDEALDELFDIFVSDPSMQVRDRAGCNISDCGNFKRVQRMRMVPKFLALAQDSSASPQMRNWSLLALHEITDENYPTAAAWQSWFDQHSAEKLQQFQDAEWWQVRGDE